LRHALPATPSINGTTDKAHNNAPCALHALQWPVRKTSVYLTDAEAEALKRASAATGRSQSALIRDGISQVIQQSGVSKRHFHSLGIANSGGEPYERWDADELYKRVMGQE
jgi:hypothetical protein